MSTETRPKCSSCLKTIRKQKQRQAKDETELDVYKHIRGFNQLPFASLSFDDSFCYKCHLQARRILQNAKAGCECVEEEIEHEDTVEQVQDSETLIDLKRYTSDRIQKLCGFTEAELEKICSFLKPTTRTKSNMMNLLGMLLMKMKHNLSNTLLAALFGYANDASVSHVLKSLRKNVMENFVPRFLGCKSIPRSEVMKRVPSYTRKLFGVSDDKLIVIMDGTYLYIQKSSNYKIQRRFFSMQKGRPLIKPMMLVTPDGYIVDVLGPYVAANNDADITIEMFMNARNGILDFFETGDTIIVDRGFRDCLSLLRDLGLLPFMPYFMPRGAKQHSVFEANESRKITKVRWAVESKNGHLKQKYRLLGEVIHNRALDAIDEYLRTACALENCFAPPLVIDSDENDAMVALMLSKVGEENRLFKSLQQQNLIKSRSSSKWCEMQDTSILDFPKLNYDDLFHLTIGIYQICNAPGYTAEHLKADGTYKYFYVRESPNILRFKIQSRHCSSKAYELFVEVDAAKEGRDAITGWYCGCPVGARVNGCCSHVASVLWYLGCGRFDELKAPAGFLDEKFIDANSFECI